MANDLKAKVQTQFGAASEAYATSTIHAKGKSLKILTDLIHAEPDWLMIDVATGAGHTALAFAPKVGKVIATDLTEAMVNKAADMAAQRGLTNVETRPADAEELPFADNTFDLVTCRIAFHHFPHPRQALREFARVLKPGGVLGFADNISVADKVAAQYYNDYEKLRDPSHVWVPSLEELQAMLVEAGFVIEVTRQFSKEMEFHDWADRMRVSAEDKERLLEMMRNIPAPLESLLMPHWENDTVYFSLREVVIIAHLWQD
ncbi:MAG: methyltransferase domain-containing protein [Anaerolineae bacterium]|nr:methyltransferase domain-containing protein [Anaerolineae bacterium]